MASATTPAPARSGGCRGRAPIPLWRLAPSARGSLPRLAQREQTEERARRDLERADSMLAETRGREEETQTSSREMPVASSTRQPRRRAGRPGSRSAMRSAPTRGPGRERSGAPSSRQSWRRSAATPRRRAGAREAPPGSPGARAPDLAGARDAAGPRPGPRGAAPPRVQRSSGAPIRWGPARRTAAQGSPPSFGSAHSRSSGSRGSSGRRARR